MNYRKRIVTHFRFVATYQSYVSTMYHDDCRFCNNPELRILVQVFDVYSDENMCFLTSFFFSLFVSLYFTEFILDNLWRVIFFSFNLSWFFFRSVAVDSSVRCFFAVTLENMKHVALTTSTFDILKTHCYRMRIDTFLLLW